MGRGKGVAVRQMKLLILILAVIYMIFWAVFTITAIVMDDTTYAFLGGKW